MPCNNIIDKVILQSNEYFLAYIVKNLQSLIFAKISYATIYILTNLLWFVNQGCNCSATWNIKYIWITCFVLNIIFSLIKKYRLLFLNSGEMLIEIFCCYFQSKREPKSPNFRFNQRYQAWIFCYGTKYEINPEFQ